MSVPKKPLDPLFEAAERKFTELKALREAGRLPEKEYQAELQKLGVRDGIGRYWMIGGETGDWYMYEGNEWVRRAPPPPPPPPPFRVSLPPRSREGRRVSVRSEREAIWFQYTFLLVAGLVTGMLLAGISLVLNLAPILSFPSFGSPSVLVAESQISPESDVTTRASVTAAPSTKASAVPPTPTATTSVPNEATATVAGVTPVAAVTPASPTAPAPPPTRLPPTSTRVPTTLAVAAPSASPTVSPTVVPTVIQGPPALLVLQVRTDPPTPPTKGTFRFVVTFQNTYPNHIDFNWRVGLWPADDPGRPNSLGDSTITLGRAEVGKSDLLSGTYNYTSGGERRCFLARVWILADTGERVVLDGPGQNLPFCVGGP